MDFQIKDKVLERYLGTAEEVIVPDGITVIGEGAFSNNRSVKRVILPKGITKIAESAFSSCCSLEFINLPDGLREIGTSAFWYNSNLTGIRLPDSLEVIEHQAFAECRDVDEFFIPQKVKKIGWGSTLPASKRYVVDETNPVFSSVDGIIYNKEKTEILYVPKNINGRITLPQELSIIKENAFVNRKNLVEIILPATLEEIKDGAFTYAGIESITLPSGIKSIGANAFHGCQKLTEVVMPDSVIQLSKGAFSECKNLKHFCFSSGLSTIPSESLFQCELLESVVIPDGITIIEDKAFGACRTLSEIDIPKSVKKIGESAFASCTSLRRLGLKNDSAEIGNWAFYRCENLADSNGLIIIQNALFGYTQGLKEISIPEGVVTLHSCGMRVDKIHFPDSIRTIEENPFGYGWGGLVSNVPHPYLQQTGKIDPEMTIRLLKTDSWKKDVTLKDYAGIRLFQTNKKLLLFIEERVASDPDSTLRNMIELLVEKGSASHYQRAAEFYFAYKAKVSQDTINQLYSAAEKAKATKARDLLKEYAISKDNPPVASIVQEANTSKNNPIEDLCKENYAPYALQQYLKQVKIKDAVFSNVHYKYSTDIAPVFTVECAIVPYMQLLAEKPKNIGDYETDYVRFSFIDVADRIAESLDSKDLAIVLDTLLGKGLPSAPEVIVPYGRFANGKQIDVLAARMKEWARWYDYAAKGRTGIMIARGAMMLNDSREAMLYADKNSLLYHYASIRGTDAEALRDNVLANFGLDENGKRSLDIGNTTIEVSMNPDLSLSLYDTEAGKAVKSIPKKGADPQKFDVASAELSDMKKNLKKVTKSRKDLLLSLFISGRKRKADSWQQSYVKNPVLHKIAELIIWCQKKDTFTLSKDGYIDCNGNPYQLQENVDVAVAHPISMKPEEIRAWQHYFAAHELKQPFEQVWEPVYDPKTIAPDRYKGILIPYYRFVDQPSIYAQESNRHTEVTISFAGCDATVRRDSIPSLPYEKVSMDDLFEVEEIQYDKKTRGGNHTIAYLDKITTIGRIMQDDITIGDSLSRFTLAQITTFIGKAQEANAASVLAVLLDFKNKHFSDFDPMSEFTLDW